MSRRPPPPHRYVYVIGPSQGLQKVGIATDPKQRLATHVPTSLRNDVFIDWTVFERQRRRMPRRSVYQEAEYLGNWHRLQRVDVVSRYTQFSSTTT